MTDRVALLMDLADRVEKADGADRELDVAIHQFLERPVLWAVDDDGCEYQALVSVPLYTASLDAALSLVPEGWHIALDPVFWIDGERVAYDAFCIMPMWEKWRPHEAEAWLPRVKARHAEKPLAAAAAALRALASELS